MGIPVQGPRVAFADQLRGLAALLVVLSHHAGVFWHFQPIVADVTGMPRAFDAPPPGTEFLSSIVSGPFRFGPAGVALFFLISGYVIPFSLRGRDRRTFLLARLTRLLPTYWAGFAVQAVVLVAALHLTGGTFPRSAAEIAFNLLPGLHLLVWTPTFDAIAWTLDIEACFYLLAALLAPALLARSAWVLALPAGAGLVGAALTLFPGWVAQGPSGPFFQTFTGLAIAAPMLIFMSIGTVLHLAEHDPRWRRAAPAVIPVLLLAFAALLQWWPRGSMGAELPSYFAMAALFIAAYALRHRIPAWRWPTRLAAISYPLYVVHGVSGYAIMIVLARLGWPPFALIATAIAYSLLVAIALHHLVEEPTRRLSSRMGRRVRAKPPADAVAVL